MSEVSWLFTNLSCKPHCIPRFRFISSHGARCLLADYVRSKFVTYVGYAFIACAFDCIRGDCIDCVVCSRIVFGDCWRFPSIAQKEGYMILPPNKSVETNRRPASPLDAGRQFERASCAPPSLSAAVAHLWR